MLSEETSLLLQTDLLPSCQLCKVGPGHLKRGAEILIPQIDLALSGILHPSHKEHHGRIHFFMSLRKLLHQVIDFHSAFKSSKSSGSNLH